VSWKSSERLGVVSILAHLIAFVVIGAAVLGVVCGLFLNKDKGDETVDDDQRFIWTLANNPQMSIKSVQPVLQSSMEMGEIDVSIRVFKINEETFTAMASLRAKGSSFVYTASKEGYEDLETAKDEAYCLMGEMLPCAKGRIESDEGWLVGPLLDSCREQMEKEPGGE